MEKTQFKLPEGVKVADLTGIEEGYDETKTNDNYYLVRINVSAGNIASYFLRLISALDDPGFFVVELPVSKKEEADLRKKDSDPCHKHVYYLDGITRQDAADIFEDYRDIFVNDGMVNFGFGSITHEEVYVGAYKIFDVYTPEPEKFRDILMEMGVPQSGSLRTVKDNISQENPGERCAMASHPNVSDMLSEVMEMGFYLADTRED